MSRRLCSPESLDLMSGSLPAQRSPQAFDTKKEVGRKRLRQLKRFKAILLIVKKLKLPFRQPLADRLWQRLLSSLDNPASPFFSDVEPLKISGSVQCHSWNQLKYWTFLTACLEQHEIYERLLKRFDPNIDIVRAAHPNACFFGSGHGQSTLNAYRLLPLPGHLSVGKCVFEKIYSNGFSDIQRVQWLERHFGAYLRSAGVYLPQLLDVQEGDQLTATYAERITGRRLANRKVLSRGLQVVKTLWEAPLGSVDVPAEVTNLHSKYKSALSGARRWLESHQPDKAASFDRLAAEIETAFPRVLSHGDLHGKNMLSTGAILDWDNCGVFPVGYDFGMLFSKSWKAVAPESIETFIVASLDAAASDEGVIDIVTGTMFFTFVFGTDTKSQLSFSDLHRLLNRLLSAADKDDVIHDS